MAEPKVAREAAEAEFERFCEAMDLDVDPDSMNAEDKSSFDTNKRRVIRAIMRGSLTFDEGGEAVFTPTKSEPATPIRFPEPTGADVMEMDKERKDHDVHKLHAVAASITGQPRVRFAKMVARDWKVIGAITGFYMGG